MILKAEKIAPLKLPRPQKPIARNGLTFQKNFTKKLRSSAPEGFEILSEPWFSYFDSDAKTTQICSPDILAIDSKEEFIIVLEVKFSYTPLALEKLQKIYCPVVSRAFDLPSKPIVVCKSLNPSSPRPQPSISFALLSQEPLIQWLGQGPIQW